MRHAVEALTVARGVVSVKNEGQKSVTYGDLLGDKPFNHKYEPVSYRAVGVEVPRTNPNNAPQKAPADYKIVGSRVPRFDMPDKVSGKYTYMGIVYHRQAEPWDRSLDVHISHLRRKLEAIGLSPIRTLRNAGYQFSSDSLERS